MKPATIKAAAERLRHLVNKEKVPVIQARQQIVKEFRFKTQAEWANFRKYFRTGRV